MPHKIAIPGENVEPTYAPAVKPSGVLALSVGSLGIVYGDIGTSPLYAFREAIT
ncbi:MAG TPA: KUP/HAK/KT family potassium transporter, partial [Bradyrhizobium sp.]